MSEGAPTLLLVDDDEVLRGRLAAALKARGYDVRPQATFVPGSHACSPFLTSPLSARASARRGPPTFSAARPSGRSTETRSRPWSPSSASSTQARMPRPRVYAAGAATPRSHRGLARAGVADAL
jgi:hypothetical protein